MVEANNESKTTGEPPTREPQPTAPVKDTFGAPDWRVIWYQVRSKPLLLGALILSLIASALVVWAVHYQVSKQSSGEFQRDVGSIVAGLQSELDRYTEAVSAAGDFAVANQNITLANWTTYVRRLQSGGQYPGLKALWFIEAVPHDKQAAFEKAMQAQLGTDAAPAYRGFRVHPVTQTPVHYTVKYINPIDESSSMPGYDLGSVLEFRTALESSRDTGELLISGEVSTHGKESEFFLMQPLYKQITGLDTLENRREQFYGFVNAVLDPGAMLQGALADYGSVDALRLGVYDGLAANSERLLYSFGSSQLSQQLHVQGQDDAEFLRESITLHLGSRPWTLSVVANSEYGLTRIYRRALVTSILVAILLVALIGWSIVSLVSSNTVSNRELSLVGRKLGRREAELQALTSIAPFGIFISAVDGRCLYSNAALHGLIDGGSEQVHVRRWFNNVHPDEREEVLRDWKQAVDRRSHFQRDYRYCLENGDVRWVSAKARPLIIDDELVGYIGAVRDLTELRLAQESVRLTESQLQHELSEAQRQINQLTAALRSGKAASKSKSPGTKETEVEVEVGHLNGAVEALPKDALAGMAPNFEANRKAITGPLGTIMGYAEMLEDPALSSDDQAIAIRSIKRNGERLLELMNDLFNSVRSGTSYVGLKPDGKRAKVLLAQENAETQILYSNLLRKMGVDPIVVGAGQEAIDKVLTESFDLVLMDMELPEVDGVSAVRMIREQGCKVPIVAFSDEVLRSNSETYQTLGCQEFLGRPCRSDQFRAVVKKYLGGSYYEQLCLSEGAPVRRKKKTEHKSRDI